MLKFFTKIFQFSYKLNSILEAKDFSVLFSVEKYSFGLMDRKFL